MKLLIINGSPRGRRSNTAVILKYFLKGYSSIKGNRYEIVYLSEMKDNVNLQESIQQSDGIILAFPLYIDFMPAIVKFLFENSLYSASKKMKRSIGFIVNSGYPGVSHSLCLERYLQRLSEHLGWEYSGMAIKDGMEGVRVPFAWIFNGWIYFKTFINFYILGRTFVQENGFDGRVISRLRKKANFFGMDWWHLLNRLGVVKAYWGIFLIKNRVFSKRFNALYRKGF